MQRRRTAPLTLAIVLAAAVALNAQSPDNPAVARLEAVISDAMQKQKIPGLAIGLVRDGRVVLARGFGVMDLTKPDRPVTADALPGPPCASPT